MQTIKAQINELKGRIHEYTLNYENNKGLKLVMAYRNILGQVWNESIVNKECVELLNDLKYYWIGHGLNINSEQWNK